jgi:Aldolase/RraA
MDASFEHVAAIPPRIVRDVPRLDPLWLTRFADVSNCDIGDHVGRLYTVEGVEALYRPMPRMVGQALTVKPWPGDGLAVHGAASLAQDGDVLVVDARGYTGVTGAGFKMLAPAGPRAARVRHRRRAARRRGLPTGRVPGVRPRPRRALVDQAAPG